MKNIGGKYKIVNMFQIEIKKQIDIFVIFDEIIATIVKN